MILAVVGSRWFSDYSRMKRVLSEYSIKKIVSGGAQGADSLAERYAKENSIPVLKYIPDWSKGKSAGIKRNVKIVDDAEGVVAFWDGASPGTKHSVDLARKNNKLFRIEWFGSADPVEYSFSEFRLTSKKTESTEYVLPRVEIYTDGSSEKASKGKEARSGWGYCVMNENLVEVASGEKPGATNNDMELRAFYEGLKRGFELGLPFDIFSDSQYTLKSFYDPLKTEQNRIEFSCQLSGWSKSWTNSGSNPDNLTSRKNGPLLLDIYNLLRENKQIYRVYWVRGHNNLLGNEIADRLAGGKSLKEFTSLIL